MNDIPLASQVGAMGSQTQAPASTVRGPLRFEVETSSPLVEAGRPFTVYLRVTNPFEVPVRVDGVHFQLPVEFIDETRTGGDPRLRWRGQFGLPPVKQGTTVNPFGPHTAVAVSGHSRTGGLGASADAEPVTIQPGNTMVTQVALRTHGWLVFTPAVYNLEAVVEYQLGGQAHTDSVKVPLNVKAPLPALITGGVVGAVAGSVVGLLLNRVKWPQALTNVMLSVLVIVAFARKKEAQPFVSIEDFYGGLFIGFMVSLSGPSWLDWFVKAGDKLTGPEGGASAPAGAG